MCRESNFRRVASGALKRLLWQTSTPHNSSAHSLHNFPNICHSISIIIIVRTLSLLDHLLTAVAYRSESDVRVDQSDVKNGRVCTRVMCEKATRDHSTLCRRHLLQRCLSEDTNDTKSSRFELTHLIVFETVGSARSCVHSAQPPNCGSHVGRPKLDDD